MFAATQANQMEVTASRQGLSCVQAKSCIFILGREACASASLILGGDPTLTVPRTEHAIRGSRILLTYASLLRFLSAANFSPRYRTVKLVALASWRQEAVKGKATFLWQN